jgi:hypothetical protein
MKLSDALERIALAWSAPGQPQATFAAAGEAFRDHIGFGLYTITHILPGGAEVERLHSTRPDIYPVGGRKPVVQNAYRAQVFGEHKPFLGRTVEDFRAFFADHETISAMGLGAVINLPLVYDGVGLGTVNLLDRAGAYDTHHLAPAVAISRMVLPALLALRN